MYPIVLANLFVDISELAAGCSSVALSKEINRRNPGRRLMFSSLFMTKAGMHTRAISRSLLANEGIRDLVWSLRWSF
jgi:hypothetical protein